MTATEALRKLGITQFDTNTKYDLVIGEEPVKKQLTAGNGIKLYRTDEGEIFGMVGIDLTSMISTKTVARINVHIGTRAQRDLLEMAKALSVKYPHCLSETCFDFALHAPLQLTGGNSAELLESSEWSLNPGLQFALKRVQEKKSEMVSRGAAVTRQFHNPIHLIEYFLGNSKFKFAVNMEEDTYNLGRSSYQHTDDLARGILLNPRHLEIGVRPHLPTVEGRSRQLLSLLNEYQPNVLDVEGLLAEVMDHYSNINVSPFVRNVPEVEISDTDEEGW